MKTLDNIFVCLNVTDTMAIEINFERPRWTHFILLLFYNMFSEIHRCVLLFSIGVLHFYIDRVKLASFLQILAAIIMLHFVCFGDLFQKFHWIV